MKNVVDIINLAKNQAFTSIYHLDSFTMEELIELTKLADKNNIDLRIKVEHSQLYIGPIIEIQRKEDTVEQRLDNSISDFEIRLYDKKNNRIAYKKLTKGEMWRFNKIIDINWKDDKKINKE